jgi:nucleoside-diphosphate-sugar epimerase
MKKILVTGATGFIGSQVIEELLKKRELQIIATARCELKARTFSWYKHVIFIPYDIQDKKSSLLKFFHFPDSIIHLAWSRLDDFNSPVHIDQNLSSHYQFLKTLIDEGLSDLNLIGTCLEYGMKSGELTESTPPNPINSYSLAKNSLRKSIENYIKNKDVSLKWLRLFYMHGEGQSKASLFSQLEQAIKNNEPHFNMSYGEQLRDYLPIQKMAEAIVCISMQSKIIGIINCCSGKPVSIRRLVECYLQKRGVLMALNLGFYAYPEYEPMEFWGSNTKLQKIKDDSK